MILPMFADQHANAQRLSERRRRPPGPRREELRDAILHPPPPPVAIAGEIRDNPTAARRPPWKGIG